LREQKIANKLVIGIVVIAVIALVVVMMTQQSKPAAPHVTGDANVDATLYEMGILNPSVDAAPGYGGFELVRPIDWVCKASSGELTVQWINGAGETINVTATGGGCEYYGDSIAVGEVFTVFDQERFTCTYTNLAGCLGAPLDKKFESTITLTRTDSLGMPVVETGSIWGIPEA
jgi:hypothetical protein